MPSLSPLHRSGGGRGYEGPKAGGYRGLRKNTMQKIT